MKVYENCMVVFVLKIAKIARFLYGIVQKLYKNWTIFFHREDNVESFKDSFQEVCYYFFMLNTIYIIYLFIFIYIITLF